MQPVGSPTITEVNPVARAGPAGTVVPTVTFVAQDGSGNPVPNVAVNFAVIAGSGTLTGALADTSDANGLVTAPEWRLGKSATGSNGNKLRASAVNYDPADVSATVQSNYNIVVRYYGANAVSTAHQQVFTRAAQRISGIITGEVPNVNAVVTQSDYQGAVCTGPPDLNEIVDDVLIFAEVKTMDGPGGNLGSAKPCFVRQGATCGAGCNNLPVIGIMSFDVADLSQIDAQGNLEHVITHEMLHVIGVGSLWAEFGLVAASGTADPQYTGAEGTAGCQQVGGTIVCASSVPIENVGGGGSIESHWREATFGVELMTSTIVFGSTNNPLSSITLRSLADLGYTVNTSADDPYAMALGSIVAAPSSSLAAAGGVRQWEIVGRPTRAIDLNGAIRPLRPRQ